MTIRTLLLIAALGVTATASAQNENLMMGFRAGLSMSRLHGPLETNAMGEELESYTNATGFHIGFIFGYKFTDLFGVRGELNFSQRGTKYAFEGESYYLLGQYTSPSLLLKDGTRNQTLTVTNAYLDVPVMVYYKLGHFELAGGLNTGLLVGSTGGGTMTFSGISPNTQKEVTPFDVSLQHNYFKDDAMGASSATFDVTVDGRKYKVPVATGAYYDFTTKDKNLYQSLDFGLVGSLAYYLNEGLFVSARYMHGLSDADRNEYDISLAELQANNQPVQRADKNTTRNWQFSIGFSF
jgi:hypothetical protein